MDSISGRNILVQVLRQHWKSKFKIVYKNYEFISNFFFTSSNVILLISRFRVGNVFGVLFILGLIGAIMYLTTMSYMKQSPNTITLQNLTNVTHSTLRSIFTIRWVFSFTFRQYISPDSYSHAQWLCKTSRSHIVNWPPNLKGWRLKQSTAFLI